MRLLSILLSFILFGGVSTPVQNDRPNILVIIADDMGVDAWARAGIGNSMAATPQLDALADQGVSFPNAWATPTCSPTRATILSGMYGSKNGVLEVGDILDLSYETLFEAIDRVTGGEYAIGAFGKWHIGPNRDLDNPNEQGADIFHGYLGGAPSDYQAWSRVVDGVSSTSTNYLTSEITSAAIEWKDEQSTPWLLWMAHAAAHTPFHTPPDSLYSRDVPTTELDQYLAMIEALDFETGRLLASMSTEELENTIVFFIGDNGTPTSVLQGFPNRRGKGSLYQGGLNVPMFVSGYGVERSGETDESLVHVMDMHATILELLGEDLAGGVNNSFSFKDRLTSEDSPSRPFLLSETQNDMGYGYAIRNEKYKVIQQVSGDLDFFDLVDDPFERNDLLDSGLTLDQQSRYAILVEEAQMQLNGWSCNDGIVNGAEDGSSCGLQTSVEIADLPGESLILSAFPNPFHFSTTVSFGLPFAGDIRLSVSDMIGREVAVLVANQTMPAGNHTVQFNADGLASGTYLVRIQAGDVVDSIQIVLQR